MKKLIESFKAGLSLVLQDTINLIHYFDGYGKATDEVKKYGRQLRKTGLITIENFITPEECDAIRAAILGLAEKHPHSEKLESGAYMNYRDEKNTTGADHGMLDIFNIDRAVPGVKRIDVRLLQQIVESTVGSQQVQMTRVNAYVNRGVTGTRGYHVDNTQPVIYKAFIYLTDVPDDSYGPYAIVKRSQRFSPYVYWNLFRNIFVRRYEITDMPVHSQSKATHVTAKKGTMILSNQNAIHRGLPQAPGRERIALIYNFLVISKLNYIHDSAKQSLEGKAAQPAATMMG